MRRTLPRSNPSSDQKLSSCTWDDPSVSRIPRLPDSWITTKESRRRSVIRSAEVQSTSLPSFWTSQRSPIGSARSTSERRLGTAGTFIASGRRVSSRDKGPPLPRESRAAASESTATAGCRWTTSCCCDHWTSRGRSPLASTFRRQRPTTTSGNIDRLVSHILAQF